MKKLSFIICITVVFCCCNLLAFSQNVENRKLNPEQPLSISPKSHDPNFLKSGKLSERSFYQRKSEWQHIIDSTWGPGDSLPQKLLIFNTYAKKVHDEFTGFVSLKLNYDSLYNLYLNQIKESTSRGAFASIMNHFAYSLKDGAHTFAFDKAVVNTPLNPGVPLLYSAAKFTVEHFGAVTTVLLSDTSTLVLRVAPNHPLNLEPGDIILGYEGIPWKKLITELREAGLPMISENAECKSADTYLSYSGAGMNWHLFNTIDVLKYTTGDTVHLSLQPMINFKIPPMVSNEQLPIDNIPFPNTLPFNDILSYPPSSHSDTLVTFGKIKDTNIGYIYLVKEDPYLRADIQLNNAISTLKNTDALILDLRKNYGGWAMFAGAFDFLFNESQMTLEEAVRCNTESYDLCTSSQKETYKIDGSNADYFDRPIAVLLGPGCVSMGDVTAHRLRYHPMVRFFGASPPASFRSMDEVVFPGWASYVGFMDMYHVENPGVYLSGKEFPIDYPVWFNKDDVAKGIDPIVEKSLDWINNLAYGRNLIVEKEGFLPVKDTVKIDAFIQNPNSHQISAKLIFESVNGSTVDSTEMMQVNLSNGNNWQGILKMKDLPENKYWISVKVTDQTEGTSFNNKHMTQISNVPLMIDKLSHIKTADNRYSIQTQLKNGSESINISNITVKLSSSDSWITSVSPEQVTLSGLGHGQIKRIPASSIIVDEATFTGYVNLSYTISEDGWPNWVIDTTIYISTVGLTELMPPVFNLEQNYPNPFNSVTTISWQLAKSSHVTLKVLDIVGRTVATLVDEQRPQGKYETQFNAGTLPKGIYFCQLKAGEFSQTRKMILME